MPMIDVYAAAGTFGYPRALAQKLASELMAIEQVPDIPMFRQNTRGLHPRPAPRQPVQRRRRLARPWPRPGSRRVHESHSGLTTGWWWRSCQGTEGGLVR
jgi:hypothetical protein